mmetsp:Transcript_141134/g.450836  ORF Transcript_141134/g.450836 Transcript_141134/m.450836 type:complete len:624 (+) Transcript_141134:60-1931(+)
MASTMRSDDGDHIIGTRPLDSDTSKECAPRTVMRHDNRGSPSSGKGCIVQIISSSRDMAQKSSVAKRINSVFRRTSPVPNQKLLSKALGGASQGAPLDSDVLELVTFTGCEELLRASHLVTVLQHQGRIFRSSAGSAATYQMSQETDRIGTFISHNWSVPGYKKFVALTFHFNFNISAMVSSAVALGVGVGNCVGVLPVVTVQVPDHPVPIGIICRSVLAPVFLIMLLFVNDLKKLIGIKGPRVFLDKMCIHQEDADIQRRGIERLGAFLCHSETMVALYTDVYLLKLWTVYEVAAFLSLHSTKRMNVLPTFVPMVFCSGMCLTYMSRIALLLSDVFTGFALGVPTLRSITALLWCYVIRQWARDKVSIRSRLENFSVSECICFDERDRPLVCRNIAVLMCLVEAVPKDSDEAAALEAFDKLVRAQLPHAIAGSVGRHVLKYKYLLCIALVDDFSYLMDECAGLRHGMPVRHMVANVLSYVPTVVAVFPMISVWLQVWSSRCLNLRGCAELLYLLAILLFLVLPIFLLYSLVLSNLRSWSLESDIGMAALAGMTPIAGLGAWLTFGWHPGARAGASTGPSPNISERGGGGEEAEATPPPEEKNEEDDDAKPEEAADDASVDCN